jgi:taurine dioxygenase
VEFETIKVTPSTPNIGAEIAGIDLMQPLANRQVQELHEAFARHQVVFFRDQKMDFDALLRLARLFGELHHHVGKSTVSEPTEQPAIRRQHFDANSERVSGEAWHTDQSCAEVPPLGSILYNHIIPPNGGGDTMFTSMYSAYDALSPRMQSFIESLTATHEGAHIFGPGTPAASHPVVARHPVTGKKLLFVNPSFTTRINELSRPESDSLLKFLFEHQIHPDWTMRFRWTPHSIAFWDNRCTQHRAVWDYWPETRSGYRIQINGAAPPIAA